MPTCWSPSFASTQLRPNNTRCSEWCSEVPTEPPKAIVWEAWRSSLEPPQWRTVTQHICVSSQPWPMVQGDCLSHLYHLGPHAQISNLVGLCYEQHARSCRRTSVPAEKTHFARGTLCGTAESVQGQDFFTTLSNGSQNRRMRNCCQIHKQIPCNALQRCVTNCS